MELVNFINDILVSIQDNYSLTNNDYNDVLNHITEIVSITHNKNIRHPI